MEEQRISFFIDEWEKVKAELHRKFSNREQNGVPELMKKGTALFYEMLFWCNKRSVELSREKLEQLNIKPINAAERLSFIASRPSNYHSYVQLSELFMEMQKIFSKEQIMKKASKP